MKKLFSLLLVLALCLSLFPAAALADEPAGADTPGCPENEEATPPSPTQAPETSPLSGEASSDPDALAEEPPADDLQAAVASGECGEVSWLYEDGILTISGSGWMTGWGYESGAPWYSYRKSITEIILPEGLCNIGQYAFFGCEKVSRITIPYGVTYIESRAFQQCRSLSSITIPSTVRSVGDYAFNICDGLKDIEIAYGVTSIGVCAFGNCRFSELTIPESVQKIGSSAFHDCSSLTSVTIPSSVASFGKNAFSACNRIQKVYIQDLSWWLGLSDTSGSDLPHGDLYLNGDLVTEIAVPDGVFNLRHSVFKNMKSLQRVTLPEDLQSIGEEAFSGCSNLMTIRFSGSAPSFDERAFYGVNVMVYYPSDDPTWTEDVRQNYGGTITWVADGSLPSGQCGDNLTWTLDEGGTLTISGTGDMWDWNWDGIAPWNEYKRGISEVVILPGATSIGDSAFSSCTSLTSVTIPEGVTGIKDSAFFYCSSLTSVEIPESVTSIGDGAFLFCSSLASVTIPSSVTSIGNSPFNYCNSLTDIYYGGTRESWKMLSVIYDYYTVTVHCSDGEISRADTMYCGDSLIWMINDSGVLTVAGSGDMWDFGPYKAPWINRRDEIKSVRILSGVTSLGSEAFSSCSSLTSVEVPESVTSIGSDAFGGCSSLASVTIPSSVTSIEPQIFYGCSSLKSVTIPAGVTSIGDGAFLECSSLTSITIPSRVTYINDYAFGSCNKLTEIRFEGPAPSFGRFIFTSPVGGSDVTATAYYPANDPTWTEDVRQNYGGSITWVAYESEPAYTPGDINGDGALDNADVTQLIFCIKYGSEDAAGASLDVNGDGELDNRDVTRLIRCIHYGGVDIF